MSHISTPITLSARSPRGPKFLSLPPELRVYIYNLIAHRAPFTCPITKYDGLRLAARQICEEFETECSKVFTKWLEDVSKRHVTVSKNARAVAASASASQAASASAFSPASTATTEGSGPSMALPSGPGLSKIEFRALQHLTLHLSFANWTESTSFSTPHILCMWKPITELHLKTLTLILNPLHPSHSPPHPHPFPHPHPHLDTRSQDRASRHCFEFWAYSAGVLKDDVAPFIILETKDRWWWDNVKGLYPFGKEHPWKVAWVRQTGEWVRIGWKRNVPGVVRMGVIGVRR
jgi:hypothetical protein